MDTRFWGPSAWVLLHSIVYLYTPNKKYLYKLFFENLRNVLPCIYCRVSFTEYIEKIPIDNYLTNNITLSDWLYQIHNLVNDKLKSQGLLNTPNPTLNDVIEKYKTITVKKCLDRNNSIMSWNFLYSIAFNYSNQGINNLLLSQYNGYFQFFNQLGDLLPSEFSNKYKKYLSKNSLINALENRNTLCKWLYNLEIYLSNKNCPNYVDIENLVESYRAGCGGLKKDLKPTCRKM